MKKARMLFTRALHSALRAGSTIAFRAKVFGKTLREINGIRLDRFADAPLRREAIKQTAIAVNVFGRHLPAAKRRELLRKITKRTVVTRYKPHGISAGGINLLGAYATWHIPYIHAAFLGAGVAKLLTTKIGASHYSRFTHRITLDKERILTASQLHETTHALQYDKTINMPKKVRKSNFQEEEMASAAQGIYNYFKIRNQAMRLIGELAPETPIRFIKVGEYFPTEAWKTEKNPYTRGHALGMLLGATPFLPGGSKQRPWTLLHAVSRGRITPEQAYEIAYRRYNKRFPQLV